MVWSYKKRRKKRTAVLKTRHTVARLIKWKSDIKKMMLFLAALLFTIDCIPKPIFIQAFMRFCCCLGGEGGSSLKKSFFLAARIILYGVKMHPGQESWLKNVK